MGEIDICVKFVVLLVMVVVYVVKFMYVVDLGICVIIFGLYLYFIMLEWFFCWFLL